jgi:hypothetical protein
MFIQTEPTPNPNAMKFLPGEAISPEEPRHFASKEDSKVSPLARKLFTIDGVLAVFFGSDFITVTKSEEFAWEVLKPEIIMFIMDHLAAKLPIFDKVKEKKELPTGILSDIEKANNRNY